MERMHSILDLSRWSEMTHNNQVLAFRRRQYLVETYQALQMLFRCYIDQDGDVQCHGWLMTQ
jgi:hypothetical protein